MKKILVFAFLALVGCEAEEEQSVKVINFDKVKEIPADLIIEKVVVLESDTSDLLGEDLKVQHGKDGFLSWISRVPKASIIFRRQGSI